MCQSIRLLDEHLEINTVAELIAELELGAWAHADCGNEVPAEQCDKAAKALSSLLAENARLKEAAQPFVDFAANVDADGWTSTIHREQISTWFGPSDFRNLRAALHGDPQ